MLTGLIARATDRIAIDRRIPIARFYNAMRFAGQDKAREALFNAHLARPLYPLSMNDGWAVDTSGHLPHLDKLIAAAKAIAAEGREVKAGVKDFLLNLTREEDYRTYPAMLDFATSPEILSIVGGYLGQVPILSELQVWRSNTAAGAPPISSQMWHRDSVDNQQVKLFICVSEVGPDHGPTVILPASDSLRISKAIRYWSKGVDYRVSDETIDRFVSADRHIACTGSPGTVYFCDTCSCFHYGSRTNGSTRHIVMIQYTRVARGDFRNQSFAAFTQPEDNELRRAVLDPRYRPAIRN